MLRTASELFFLCLISSTLAWAGGEGVNTPAVGSIPRQAYDSGEEVSKTPSGAAWPIFWKFDFSKPKEVKINKPFIVSIKITPLLFGLDKVKMVCVAGEDFKLIKWENWQGALKQGQTKEIKLTLMATKSGVEDTYGVIIYSSDFYNKAKKYFLATTKGIVREEYLRHLDADKKDMPVYQEWAGGSIKVAKGPLK